MPTMDAHAPSLVLLSLSLLYLLRLRSATSSLNTRIQSLLQSDPITYSKIARCERVVEEAFERFGPNKLALAFNGGKDCLVVFQLVKARVERGGEEIEWPLLVYFETEDEFPEMTEFMNAVVRENGLVIEVLKGGTKAGLVGLVKRGIRAIFMGQRRTDPHAPKEAFSLTTPGWPEVLRVNPILDLDYAGVWGFLLGTKTKYCPLYDHGYTSLGPKSKTVKNAQLLSEDGSTHKPAHDLKAGDEAERSGRSLSTQRSLSSA